MTDALSTVTIGGRERSIGWLHSLAVVAIAVQAISTVRIFARPGRPPLNADAAVFQHGGWYITQGGIPYVDFWDPKPPLNFELTAVLATIAGGNMLVLHVLAVILTGLASVGSVVLVGYLATDITDDPRAGFLSGVTMLTLAGFHYLPAFGFRPKYYSLFFGLLGLALLRNRTPFASGMAAAASAGFWQFGVVFFPLVLWGFRWDREDLGRVLAGGGIVLLLAVLPILIWDAFVPMIVEVVIAPFLTTEPQSVLFRIGKGPLVLGYTSIVVILGLVGVATDVWPRVTLPDWFIGLGLWAGFQILLVDFDSYPDLFLGMVVVSTGVGILYSKVSLNPRRALGLVVAAVLLVSVVSFGGFGVVTYSVEHQYYPFALAEEAPADEQPLLQSLIVGVGYSMGMAEATGSSSSSDTSPALYPDMTDTMRNLYWNKVIPESCHYRLSVMERQYMELTGQTADQETCGHLPPGFLS